MKGTAFVKDKKDSLFLTSQQDRVSSGSDRRQETVGSETKIFYTHRKSGSQGTSIFCVSSPKSLGSEVVLRKQHTHAVRVVKSPTLKDYEPAILNGTCM